MEPDCVPCIAFVTPWGTYVLNVLQQGDCNSPSTFQQTMSWVLLERLRWTVHAWFDDIFTGTDMVTAHNVELMRVYIILKKEWLYISCKKFQLFIAVLDILGCKVNSHGVHADSDKMAKLC